MSLLKLLSASSLVLGLSFILRFTLTLTFARYLTSSELGVYSWVVTAFAFAGILTNYGLDFFLIGKIPEFRNKSPDLIASVIKHARNLSVKIALAVILIIVPLSYFSVYFFEGTAVYNLELIVIVLALPFAALSLIFSTSLRAFDFPITGQFIESIIQAGILLIGVLIFFNLFSDAIPKDKRVLFVVTIFVFAWIFSFLISYCEFKRSVKIPASILPTSNEDIKEWKGDQFSIFFGILGWSFLGRSDIFLLAFFVAPSEVGAYFICLRLAEVLMFFCTVAYYVWGGELSNSVQGGKMQEAQAILKQSSQLCISTTLVMASLVFMFAQEILYFVNETYADYSYLFRIALVVFLIKGASGMLKPLYYILGEQDFLAKIQWTIGLSFTGLVLITVPIYGVIGCILSFALCEAIFLMILVTRLYKKHNLSLVPF